MENPPPTARLRPRLVAQSPVPLVSDAFDPRDPGPNSSKEERAVESLTTMLYSTLVPRIANVVCSGRLSVEQVITQLHQCLCCYSLCQRGSNIFAIATASLFAISVSSAKLLWAEAKLIECVNCCSPNVLLAQ